MKSNRLKVCLVFMRFPAPSEAFAASDVRALMKQEVQVSVKTMRGAHVRHSRMVQERGLEGVSISLGGWQKHVRGLGLMALQPLKSLRGLIWIGRTSWRFPLAMAKGLVALPCSFALFQELKRERPDVVHLFWGHYPSIVGYLVRSHLPSIHVSMFLGAYDMLERFGGSVDLALNANAVWTHARVNVPILARLGIPEGRVKVVHRGITLGPFPNRRRGPLIVSAGRLLPAKGMDETLRAFAAVLTHVPSAKLEIFGEGPERQNLEALASDLGVKSAVAFRGHVSQKTFLEELSKAAIFMLMTHHQSERLPNVVKEAMAHGAVPIVSATPGIEELVTDGAGVIVQPHDFGQASAMCLQLLANPNRTNEMRLRGRRIIEDRFDATKQVAQYVRAWRRWLDQCG